MKIRDKVMIMVLAVIAVVLIGVAAGLGIYSISGDSYTRSIKKAEASLDHGDYDKAITLFQKAMKQDSSRSEAYHGLAQVYIKKNYEALAQDVLMNGIQNTQNQELRDYFTELFPNLTIDLSGNTTPSNNYSEDAVTVAKSGESGSVELNSSLLQFISRANFGAYLSKYGVTKLSNTGDIYTYSVKNIDLELKYVNNGSRNMINDKTGEPYREFVPDSISFKNLGLVFGTFESTSMPVDRIRKMTGVQILSLDEKQVVLQSYGCKICIDLNADGTFTSTSNNTVEIEPVEAEEKNHVLSGRIIDSATGKGIGDVAVLAKSLDDDDDEVETVTDSDGTYSVDISEGEFEVILEKAGYIQADYIVEIYSSTKEVTENFTLTQELASDVIRIVLTWESSPRDLDSYLRGTTGDGKRIMTSFHNKVEKNDSGDIVAELDLDDTDGEGPETTTLYDMNGVFEFVVADFNATGTMGAMGAQVDVYKGSSHIESISINSDVVNQWSVLTIDHGEVTVENRAINERTNHSSKY